MTFVLGPANTLTMAFVGGGQMAAALAGGLLDAGWNPANLLVVEPDKTQRERLKSSLGLTVLAAPSQQLKAADVVLWAVKPQVLQQAVLSALPHLNTPLHISIAAGVRSADMARLTGSKRVVRVMPNTAVLAGAGVSGLFGTEEIVEADRSLVEQILAPTGHCFWVSSDERLDAVTAVSGSGPAYAFHFLEAFQAAAIGVGFDINEARDLVINTVAGAIEQAKRTGSEFSTLRQNVTSQRGTTEAAPSILDSQGTASALADAVAAARKRASEMSRELSADATRP